MRMRCAEPAPGSKVESVEVGMRKVYLRIEEEAGRGVLSWKGRRGWKILARMESSATNGLVESLFSGWSRLMAWMEVGDARGGRQVVDTLFSRMLVRASESQWLG